MLALIEFDLSPPNAFDFLNRFVNILRKYIAHDTQQVKIFLLFCSLSIMSTYQQRHFEVKSLISSGIFRKIAVFYLECFCLFPGNAVVFGIGEQFGITLT